MSDSDDALRAQIKVGVDHQKTLEATSTIAMTRPTWKPTAQELVDTEAWASDLIGLGDHPDATVQDIAKANQRRNTVWWLIQQAKKRGKWVTE